MFALGDDGSVLGESRLDAQLAEVIRLEEILEAVADGEALRRDGRAQEGSQNHVVWESGERSDGSLLHLWGAARLTG